MQQYVIFNALKVYCIPKDYTIGICCFFAKHATKAERTKTDWLGIMIMCPRETTRLSAECCFSELALLKSYYACWSSTKRTSSSSH